MNTIQVTELNAETNVNDVEASQVTGGAETQTQTRHVGAVCYGVSVLA